MDAKMRAVRCDNGRGMLMRRRRLDRKMREENFARKIYELEETSTITCRIRRPICSEATVDESMNDVKEKYRRRSCKLQVAERV